MSTASKTKIPKETIREIMSHLTVFVGEGFETDIIDGKKEKVLARSIFFAPKDPIAIRSMILKALKKHIDSDGYCSMQISWQGTDYTLEERCITVTDSDHGGWYFVKGKYNVLAQKDGMMLYCYSENFIRSPNFDNAEKVPDVSYLPNLTMMYENGSIESESETADRLFCKHIDDSIKELDLCKTCRKFVCFKCGSEYHRNRDHKVKAVSLKS